MRATPAAALATCAPTTRPHRPRSHSEQRPSRAGTDHADQPRAAASPKPALLVKFLLPDFFAFLVVSHSL